MVAGTVVSTPERLPDGRIRLVEDWRRADGSTGVSVIEECRGWRTGAGTDLAVIAGLAMRTVLADLAVVTVLAALAGLTVLADQAA
ncbi:hypothetical protein ACFQ9X_29315 [Catenulispora yoronensis]